MPDPRPHAAAIIASHDTINALSVILSYLYTGATLPVSSPTPIYTLSVLPWQYYCSCALSLPFCPALCSCPPPQSFIFPPRTPLRAHAPHSATLATEHSLMAVATVPSNPDVLALFRLAYISRAGTEIEAAEIPYTARF